MNDQFGSIGDMITLVASNQQAEATPVLHDLLGARILDALQGHKQEIAQTLFAPGTEALAEESEQLDEISAATAYSAGRKRLAQGQGLTNASLDADKGTKQSKQYAKQADAAFDKAKKNYEYALKKDKIGFHEEAEQLEEISAATAFRVGEKRYKKGSATHAAGERSADPLTKKVLLNKAKSLFGKSAKAFEYAKKKEQ